MNFLAEVAAEEPEAAAALERVNEDAPDVDPATDWVWEAWWMLGNDRPTEVVGSAIAMGGMAIMSRPRGIPWTAIDRWCERNGYGDDRAAMLTRCMAEMDRVFIDHWDAKQRTQS